ncbi:MAG: hypothetical protein HDS23_00360 [Bacteroides sp.]|nr:hypothetical protein [Bacteroides sp.]
MNPNESLILTRIRWLLIFIFPISIVVDLISGFFTLQLQTYIPIGQWLRVLIMACALYLLTKRVRTILIWVILSPVLFFILASPLWMIIGGIEPTRGYNLGVEIDSFSKILYFLTIVTFFIVYKEEIRKQHILRIISNYGFFIAGALIISFVTGYGNHTHNAAYGFGTKSYFKAGNDLSLTILYASVTSSLYMFSHFGWKRALITLTISLSTILIGTRVGVIGIAIWMTILMCYILFIYYPKERRTRKKLRFYKPVIFFGYILCIITATNYLWTSFDNYMLKRFSMAGIKTARSRLTDPALEYIGNLEWYEAIFGRGMASLYHYVAKSIRFNSDFRMVEADFHELMGGYGLLGIIVCISPFVYFMFKALKGYFQRPDFRKFAVLFVTLSFLAVAYTAGHCFRNTMVAPIYGYMVSLMYYGEKRFTDQ